MHGEPLVVIAAKEGIASLLIASSFDHCVSPPATLFYNLTADFEPKVPWPTYTSRCPIWLSLKRKLVLSLVMLYPGALVHIHIHHRTTLQMQGEQKVTVLDASPNSVLDSMRATAADKAKKAAAFAELAMARVRTLSKGSTCARVFYADHAMLKLDRVVPRGL